MSKKPIVSDYEANCLTDVRLNHFCDLWKSKKYSSEFWFGFQAGSIGRFYHEEAFFLHLVSIHLECINNQERWAIE